MIYKILYLFDRLMESFLLRYRKLVFLARTNNRQFDINILGNVSMSRCKSIIVGNNVTIYPNVSFSGAGQIIIGNNVQIGEGTILYAHKKIYIENNVAIAGQCYIIDCNHGISKEGLIQNQPLVCDDEGISIGSDVWIGAGCKIVKGAKINDGCVIGAMSMVNSEIPKYGIAVGIPAKVKKYRL